MGKEILDCGREGFPAETLKQPNEGFAFGAVKVLRENVADETLNEFRGADPFEQF